MRPRRYRSGSTVRQDSRGTRTERPWTGPAPPFRRSAGLLDADHDDREGTRNRGTAADAPAACRWRSPRRWRWRRWPGLRCHREQMAGLAVKRDRARTVRGPGLQVLLDLETRRALLLHDGHRAVALRAERLHRRGVERRAVGTARERQSLEDLPVLRTQDD